MAGRYAKFAEGFFVNIAVRGGSEWMVSCPFHGGSDSFQFNVDTGKWFCFGCRRGGKDVKSLADDESLPDYSPTVSGLRLRLKHAAVPPKQEVFPRSWLSRFDFPTDYWKDRGLTEEAIAFWRLGYDFDDDRVTIPLLVRGAQVCGVIKRVTNNDDENVPRYKYPRGFNRSKHLFGEHVVSFNLEDLFVVEGSLDVIHLWEAGEVGVGLLGSSMSRWQADQIRKLAPQRIILAFDNDKAGYQGAERAREMLKGMHVVQWPWESHVKDFGDYSVKQRKRLMDT